MAVPLPTRLDGARQHDPVCVRCRDTKTGERIERDVDAVVFAVGVTGMQKIVSANPALGDRADFRRIMNLQGLDVVSTRLWLDRRVPTQFPANVLAGFDDDMGSTYFNLNDLHVRPPHALYPGRAVEDIPLSCLPCKEVTMLGDCVYGAVVRGGAMPECATSQSGSAISTGSSRDPPSTAACSTHGCACRAPPRGSSHRAVRLLRGALVEGVRSRWCAEQVMVHAGRVPRL